MDPFYRTISVFLFFTIVFPEEIKYHQSPYKDSFQYKHAGKIGDNPFPTNPMSDRAIGYLLQGKAQTAISNYGNIINWDEHPMGIWNGYSYLPSVAFLAGVPGRSLSSNYSPWTKCGEAPDGDTTAEEDSVEIWCSHDAYEAWYTSGDTNFVGIVFDMQNDCGNPDGSRDCGTLKPDSLSRINNLGLPRLAVR